MFKLLILSVLLVAVKSDINEFLGEWYAVVTYPSRGDAYPSCPLMVLTKDRSKTCTCGDKGETPVIQLREVSEPLEKGSPVLIITEGEDILPNLKVKCTCTGVTQSPVALKKINDNYVVMYAKNPESDEYASNVFVKTLPKLSEFEAQLEAIPDLRGKTPKYLCKPSHFSKEDA